jgi:lysine-N-methylase
LYLPAPHSKHVAEGLGGLPGAKVVHQLPQTKLFRPEYSDDFRCIGPACEDSCCEEWTVHVDQGTFEKYQNLPAGPLRTLLDENVLRTPEPVKASGGAAAATFAQIRMDSNRKCPLLSGEGLCQIQVEHGEDFLPRTCATYPRITYCIDGVTEKALSLSCPEAARVVLLNPQLNTGAGHDGGLGAEVNHAEKADPNLSYFWSIRNTALALVQNRVYPIWQRLFLLDLLSRRFDAIAPDERMDKVPLLLADVEATAASGELEASMNTLPVDHAQQLDLVLLLAGMMLHRSYVRPRFVECVQAFTQGIGNGAGATLESLTAGYAAAHDRYYAPFFQKHPYILENYLVNTIFRCRFPFGRDWVKNGAAPSTLSTTRESTLLTAQFALMKGLLIGVAGFHRERFSASHVVHTVQSASKHFEHHTEFLSGAHELLVEKRLDGQLGVAILLRNEKSRAQWPELPAPPALPASHAPIHAPSHAPSHAPVHTSIHAPNRTSGPSEQIAAFPVRRLPPN